MSFSSVESIQVGLSFDGDVIPVGTLAQQAQGISFRYDASFLEQGLSISPFHCLLKPEPQIFDPALFEGLPGVFYDSLPDGWGRLLLARSVGARGILPKQLSPLDRLSHVGHDGMGALVYGADPVDEATDVTVDSSPRPDLNQLLAQATQVLEGQPTEVLQELLRLNGSSSGARPKAMIGVHPKNGDILYGAMELPKGYEHWLVKFPNLNDGLDAGAVEYVYALMAKEAGLRMEATHLFPAEQCAGFFATKRFDRTHDQRLHCHSACGLLHADFRLPALDYKDLLDLTSILTKDIRETEQMYRLAVFNTLSHNRDDHGKNFSFLMDRTGEWKLAPAYDLTFSSGPNGEHSTMVMGQGKHPGIDDLIALGETAKLPRKTIDGVIRQTRDALGQWGTLAKEWGVGKESVRRVGKGIGGRD